VSTATPISIGTSTAQADAAEVARRVRPRQGGFAESFAQIVAVLMRDRNFRDLPVGELEWLVLPPLILGQFVLAHTHMYQPDAKNKEKSATLVPVAVALWARASSNVDRALSENLGAPIKLQPADWMSGDNFWLLALAGDQRVLPKFLAQLSQTEFKGRKVKMRKRGPDGKVVVENLPSPSTANRSG
jgi:cytolysin-activating lysine-acyltransferase